MVFVVKWKTVNVVVVCQKVLVVYDGFKSPESIASLIVFDQFQNDIGLRNSTEDFFVRDEVIIHNAFSGILAYFLLDYSGNIECAYDVKLFKIIIDLKRFFNVPVTSWGTKDITNLLMKSLLNIANLMKRSGEKKGDYSTDFSASTISMPHTFLMSSSWMKMEKKNVIALAAAMLCGVTVLA